MQALRSETQSSNVAHANVAGALLEEVGEVFELDMLRYPSVSVQLGGTFTGTAEFEISNDRAVWFPKYLSASSGVQVSSAGAAGMWRSGTGARYFRVRASALTAGAIEVHVVSSTNPLQSVVSTPAGDPTAEAISARDAAAISAGTAATKAGEAAASANLALAGQFAGAALGTANLNTITTPGVYRQGTTANATLVLNYPVASVQGVLEVFHSTATSSIFQRYMQTTGTASGKGHWQRRYTSSAWSAWGFVATQRVDQTAGRAIYTWDDVNNREQLIWGDTGARGVTASIPQITSGNAYIRRTTNSVEIILEDVVLGTLTGTQNLSFPSAGFKPHKNAPAISYLITTPIRSFVTTACEFRLYGVTSGGVINAIATYSTNEPWPSVNP